MFDDQVTAAIAIIFGVVICLGIAALIWHRRR
jgi:hypothetical protein